MKEKIFDFDKINSLILFLLIFTNLRYFKLNYNFLVFNNLNLIQMVGEICLIFLILITFIYLIKLDKKDLINLSFLIFIWIAISLILNHQIIDFSYIKKSIQIFLCFFIFLVFSKNQNKFDFKLLENLTLILISSIIIFSFFYYDLFYFLLAYLFLTLFYFIYTEKVFYFFSIFFFVVLIFYLNFVLNARSDFLDIEIFIRKNNISWTILFIFFANLIYREKKNTSLDFFIILFTFIFCAKYVFLTQILVCGVIYISKKNIKFLNYFFAASIFLPILYLIIISMFTGYYFEYLNYVFNSFFNLKNLGTITSYDGFAEKTYEISQINYLVNNFFTEIYSGLTHRALLAEVYLQKILNNQIINDSFLINIKYYSIYLKELNSQESNIFSNFYNSEFINNFSYYSKVCSKFSFRTYECAEKLGFLPMIQEYKGLPDHLTINHKAIQLFQNEVILTQNFNSSHNQFLDFLSKFGLLGVLLFLFFIFQVIKILKNNFNTINFKIIVSIIFLLLNFDNYIFYNYFNVSYLVWMFLGLSINTNYIKNKI